MPGHVVHESEDASVGEEADSADRIVLADRAPALLANEEQRRAYLGR